MITSQAIICAFGEPWKPMAGAHCIKCLKWKLKMRREFHHGVEMGWWDDEGYTPKERRAQRKKCQTPLTSSANS